MVSLQAGENPLVIKLVQPAGQRTRAFFRFTCEKAPDKLSLRGFHDPSLPRPALPAPAGRSSICYRFTSPPGFRCARIVTRGPALLWFDTAAVPLDLLGVSADGLHTYECNLAKPAALPGVLALSVDAPADSHAGDALPEPIRFSCETGMLSLGDWCRHGLATYSGAAIYSRAFEISNLNSLITLDLGDLSATAEVRVNGQIAATLIVSPWKFDITPSGLFGPVKILTSL